MGQAIHRAIPPTIPARFTVGHDSRGRWVVSDRLGAIGGTFIDRETAVRFARRESGNAPGAVRLAADSEILDLFAPAPRPQERGQAPGQPGALRPRGDLRRLATGSSARMSDPAAPGTRGVERTTPLAFDAGLQ